MFLKLVDLLKNEFFVALNEGESFCTMKNKGLKLCHDAFAN